MSTVVLKTLEWDRCFSFGNSNKINLNAAPVTQIIAPNGFGKSSIPLILEEVLYNNNSKGVKKGEIPNRLMDGSYKIVHEFSVDNVEYSVTVDRKKSGVKVYLLKEGVDISSHTATDTFKQIKDLLGPDFKVFQQLVNQSTTSSLEFLTATDTTRKKFLVDLFDLSEHMRLHEVFKAAAKSLSTEAAVLSGKVDTVTKWVNSNKSLDTTLKELVEVPEAPDLDTSQLRADLANIEQNNTRVQKNNRVRAQLAKVNKAELLAKRGEQKAVDTSEIGRLKAGKQAAEAVLTKLKGLKDKCPTCLQPIDQDFYRGLVNSNTVTATEYAAQIAALEAEVAEVRKHNALLQKVEENIRAVEALEAQFDDSIQEELYDSTTIENQLVEIQHTLAEAKAKIAAAQKQNASAMAHNAKINVYLEQREGYEKQLAESQAKLEELTKKLESLEVLKKAFSTSGLVAYELENLVKDLEQLTNKYLADLSDGRFTLEFVMSGDKLNVVVTDNGMDINILSTSSGERARINTATLLAIRNLMQSISKSTINVLFLDETVSVLDDLGKERLVEVLLKEHNLNTFVVSHGWSHPLVSKMEIKQEDGLSRIENG